jgi:hypothetical protein
MSTQPLTRDMGEVVRALEVTEAELGFQVTRLLSRLQEPSLGTGERSHLLDLLSGYGVSRRYLAILLRYHRGRQEGVRGVTRDHAPFDPDGSARAFTKEEDT